MSSRATGIEPEEQKDTVTSCTFKVHFWTPFEGLPSRICSSAVWNTTGITVAGSNNGTSGSSLAQLNSPYDLVIDYNNVMYISDLSNNRIVQWIENNTSANLIIGGNNGLNEPAGLFMDNQNNLYVADTLNSRIEKYSLNDPIGTTVFGQYGRGSSSNQLDQSYALFIDVLNNSYYISDTQNHRIMLWTLDASNGIIVAGGNGRGNGANQLNQPYGICIDSNSTIYIADCGNNRVQQWYRNFQTGNTVANGLMCPTAVVLDTVGNMYIVDQGNHRILRWMIGAQSGATLIGTTGVYGSQPNLLYYPSSIRFDLNWNLFVADYENNRIQRFNLVNDGCNGNGIG
ncbi:unnamed protein product [Didymodactylos carnosus]|uniref:NHL repeat containing protein n=1 Tax=Didymodactylos carnosus TaxID=1234261 RepID=A0A814VUA7_9BILA|nr:unnamed protein product [Didymodactylos carnosus]CAF1195827.1 unnamed protein product [Didymodactylos carnosus]CAF3824343.1 unnamed protein product [Didymodactylos carnosus]CAF3960219.1 unnamed protein product [Didymodactylos carnosus]